MKLVVFFLCFCSALASAMPKTVILLRHGEEPESGDALSRAGWQRAKRLPKIFDRAEMKSYGKPVALYASKPEFEGQSRRSIQTLRYVAETYGLKVQSPFTKDSAKKLVEEIKKDPSLDGKLVIICWPHKVLEEIAEEFGAKKVKSFPDDKFDRLWILSFSEKKKKDVEFLDLPQRLLPSDDSQ